ncbi:MAG: hypothetical protein KKE12_10005, partial [Proteobacteria bacterium]|nr:hypothetical protein [Pseudomonadota bacterium]
MEKLKVLFLGLTLYISKNLFFKIGSKWFQELQNRDDFEGRADTIRCTFWKAVILNIFIVGGTILILVQLGIAIFDRSLAMRMVAIIVTLSASLGRGGWDIQSTDGKTIIEKIDRGMFKI